MTSIQLWTCYLTLLFGLPTGRTDRLSPPTITARDNLDLLVTELNSASDVLLEEAFQKEF